MGAFPYVPAEVQDDIEAAALWYEQERSGLGIYAIYPTRKHVALKVRAVNEFLTQQFSASPSF
jgi:hypothetical protein